MTEQKEDDSTARMHYIFALETERTGLYKKFEDVVKKLSKERKGTFEASCSQCGYNVLIDGYPEGVGLHVCPTCGMLLDFCPVPPKPLPCEKTCEDLCPYDEQSEPRPKGCRKKGV